MKLTPSRILLSPFALQVDFGGEGALPEIVIHSLLLLLNFLLQLIFIPESVPLNEIGTAMDKISLIGFDDRLKGAFQINLILLMMMFRQDLFP